MKGINFIKFNLKARIGASRDKPMPNPMIPAQFNKNLSILFLANNFWIKKKNPKGRPAQMA